jgi:hypothetical protein
LITLTIFDPIFDHGVLEDEIKTIATLEGKSQSFQLPYHGPDPCRSFVLSIGIGDVIPVRMRSFGIPDADPFDGCIWQAARATFAAPNYFPPIKINDVLCGGPGTYWSNPTNESIDEAHDIWPNHPIGVIVSRGTCLTEGLQLYPTLFDVPWMTAPIGSPKGYRERQSQSAQAEALWLELFLKTLRRDTRFHWRSPNTSSNVLHIARPRKKVWRAGGEYFRLNVTQRISRLGLVDWEKEAEMIASTEQYMYGGRRVRETVRIAEVLRRLPGSNGIRQEKLHQLIVDYFVTILYIDTYY